MSEGGHDLDSVLTALGTGAWQIYIYLLSGFSAMRIPPQVLSGAFIAPAVSHLCVAPYEVTAAANGSSKPDQCYDSDSQRYCTQWQYDTSVFENTATSQYDLVCSNAYLRSSYSSLYMLGSLCGSSLVGYTADWKGRKVAMDIGHIGFAIFPVLMSWVPSFTFVMICRFFVGFLHSFIISSFFTYSLEVTEPKQRGTVGIVLAFPWAIGTIAWGGLAYLIRDWRWLNFVASIPSMLCLFCVWYVQESPRWLVVNGHHDRAYEILAAAAIKNKTKLPPEDELRIIMKQTQENSSKKSKQTSDPETANTTKEILKDLLLIFRTRQLRVRVFALLFLFFLSSMVFYGLSLSAVNLSADPFIYMALGGLMEVPSYSVASPIINYWGRRMPLAYSYFVCGVTILALAFIPSGMSWLIITLAMIGKLTISMAYQVVYLYCVEILPTEVRFQGLAAAMVSSRVGSILTPYITDYLGESYWWLPSIIFGVFCLLGGFATLLLPESKGRPMPDTIVELGQHSLSKINAENKTLESHE